MPDHLDALRMDSSSFEHPQIPESVPSNMAEGGVVVHRNARPGTSMFPVFRF
jgi:hypothetical protein